MGEDPDDKIVLQIAENNWDTPVDVVDACAVEDVTLDDSVRLSLLIFMLLPLCILLSIISLLVLVRVESCDWDVIAVDSGDVLITVTAVVVSDANPASGAISSAVKALYDSSKIEEISVFLEKR